MRRWTHALRRPGPTPDRCTAEGCDCDFPDPVLNFGAPIEQCVMCGHELVPLGSRPPSDSPSPPR